MNAVANRVLCPHPANREVPDKRFIRSHGFKVSESKKNVLAWRQPEFLPELGTHSTLLTAYGAPNPPLLTSCLGQSVGTLTPARRRRLYAQYGLC